MQTKVIGFVPTMFFLLRWCLGLGVMVYCSGGCCFTADLVVVGALDFRSCSSQVQVGFCWLGVGRVFASADSL
jgi:hypothetical protein